MSKTISSEELRAERSKLETDRAVLNERLQALNADRETTIARLSMVAGALQTIEGFIDRIDPEVHPEDEIDMSSKADQNEV
jgi:ribosome assembly protein YihI (activator of Der GTPase)